MNDQVDTVDISALFAPDEGARGACDAAVWQGLRRTGAIVVIGFPGADQIDSRARTGLAIFDLDPAEKRALTTRLLEPDNPNWYRGYWPRTDDRLLQNDFYDLGPEHPAPGPDLPCVDMLTEPTPLPARDPVPGWAKTVRAHYDSLNTVAQALIRSIGRQAGFDAAEIAARFDGSHSTLRFLNYPGGMATASVEPDGTRVSGGRHTDASGLSMLWQAQPGLQAQGQDGQFRDIPMHRNAVSVHVGDVMTRMTNGVVPATPHRVVASDGPRQSVGFFLEPALRAPVTAVTAHEPDPVRDSYCWQLLETFSQRAIWQGIVPHPSSPAA